jgi:SAM-dependent methyltransferase
MSMSNPPVDRAAGAENGDYAATLRRSFSWRYAQGQDVWSGESALHAAAAALFAHLPAGGTLLDIGIGSGANVAALLAAGHPVTGVDIVTPPNWADLRAAWGTQLTLVECDFLDWEGPAGAFDMVSDLGCLHHQRPDDYGPYLHKIRRLLRAGGRLALCVYEDVGADVGSLATTDHGRLAKNFAETELRTLLSASGFALVALIRIARADGLPPYLAVVAEPHAAADGAR